MKWLPITRLGKWSVRLNIFFLTVVSISIILVNALKVLSYDDHWWDVTVNVFLSSIAAFILGLISIKKHKEPSVLVYASVGLGVLTILFLLLHSLFIND